MAQRKPFLLRLDAGIYAALEKWAAHLKLAVAQATGANVTAIKGLPR